MSSAGGPLRNWMDQALKGAQAGNGLGGHSQKRSGGDDIERIVELLEAVSSKIQALDLEQIEAAFATQAAALNVIFAQFARAAGRKYWTFDSMRVALRAQAQCRATYKGLLELKSPRLVARRAAGQAPTMNSSEQTIESAKSAE